MRYPSGIRYRSRHRIDGVERPFKHDFHHPSPLDPLTAPTHGRCNRCVTTALSRDQTSINYVPGSHANRSLVRIEAAILAAAARTVAAGAGGTRRRIATP